MGSEGSMKNEINIIHTSESWMYLVKNKALGYDLAEDWMFFWTFFIPIAMVIDIVLKKQVLIYKGFLYIAFIFAMTVIRRYIVSSFKYMLANALVIFLAFIFSFSLVEKIIFLFPIILCLIISIKKRYSETAEFYGITMLIWSEVFMAVCYFTAFSNNSVFMMNLINFASINIAVTCALYVFVSRAARLTEWESQFIKGYSKRMRKIKLSSIAFISGVIAFFILLAWWTGLYRLLDILTGYILAFLNGVKPAKINPVQTKPKAANPSQSTQFSARKLRPVIKNSYLAKVILNILQFIIYAAVAIFVIYLLYKFILKIINFYKSLRLKKTYKREEREFVIPLVDVITEIKERAGRLKVQLQFPFNMSNRKKIRKLYHKLIKSYKLKEISIYNFNTPVEIENNVREVFKKNISEATVIYEKARYSDAECTSEDVDKMKSFLAL